jgi:ABC-2 type transport system permease protein
VNIPPAERKASEMTAHPTRPGPEPENGSPLPGQAKLTWLVAEREITTRLRSKAFIASTVVLLLAVLAAVVIGGIVQKRQAERAADPDTVEVAVVGTAPEALTTGPFEVRPADDRAEAEELLRAGEAEAAVLVNEAAGSPQETDGSTAEAGGGLTILALEEAPDGLMDALTVAPTLELLDGSEDGFDAFAYIAALGFGMIFYMTALTFGMTIAQSVVEEKQTRIVEILLATVSARTMMAGKILGNSILALSNVAVVLLLAEIGMLATGQDLLLGEIGASLLWFGVLFAFGFVLVATMFAATGSMVSRQEDIGSVTSPVMLLVMAPFFLVIFFYDNEPVLTLLSYVPFSAPVGMPMRLVLDQAQWWEPLLSLGIITATITVMVWIGARIYSNSILRIGARVTFKDAVRG